MKNLFCMCIGKKEKREWQFRDAAQLDACVHVGKAEERGAGDCRVLVFLHNSSSNISSKA